jgi:hypothetical protein
MSEHTHNNEMKDFSNKDINLFPFLKKRPQFVCRVGFWMRIGSSYKERKKDIQPDTSVLFIPLSKDRSLWLL